jgi:hypothetical protein
MTSDAWIFREEMGKCRKDPDRTPVSSIPVFSMEI